MSDLFRRRGAFVKCRVVSHVFSFFLPFAIGLACGYLHYGVLQVVILLTAYAVSYEFTRWFLRWRHRPVQRGLGTSGPVREHTCLNCGAKQSGATGFNGPDDAPRPREGAISICLYCQHVAIFQSDGSLRHLTDDESEQVAGDADIQGLVGVLRVFMATRAAPFSPSPKRSPLC
jgi:hypothetical protein